MQIAPLQRLRALPAASRRDIRQREMLPGRRPPAPVGLPGAPLLWAEGAGRAGVARYAATLASLKEMQKAGRVELESRTRRRGIGDRRGVAMHRGGPGGAVAAGRVNPT
jgi:hypothetical protein